ncbi:hypothetical protein DITRI_Ditri07aG0109800 [Diplodiscus trichospermus]
MAELKSCAEWKPFIAMIAIDFSFAVVNILLKEVLDQGMNHLDLVLIKHSSYQFLGSYWLLLGKEKQTKAHTAHFRLPLLQCNRGGMIGSGLGIVGMAWCVKKRGPVFTAAFGPLFQITAAMFDIPILHEQLNLGSLLGSIVVIIGLYILLWGKKKEVKNSASKNAQEVKEIREQEAQLQVITVAYDSICPKAIGQKKNMS